MKTKGWSRQAVIASLPIVIYVISRLLSLLWSPRPWGSTDYLFPSLVVLVVLLMGAGLGVVKRLPPWSYSWVIFCVLSLSDLAQAYVARSAPSAREFGMAASLVSWAAFFVILIIAVLASFRSVRFAIFTVLLSALYRALSFPIFPRSSALSSINSSAVIWVLAIVAVAEAAFAVFAVASFLDSQGKPEVRCLYLLAAIILVDPLLNGWAFGLILSGGSFASTLRSVVVIAGGTWASTGIALLIAWGLSKLAHRLTGGRALENES